MMQFCSIAGTRIYVKRYSKNGMMFLYADFPHNGVAHVELPLASIGALVF